VWCGDHIAAKKDIEPEVLRPAGRPSGVVALGFACILTLTNKERRGPMNKKWLLTMLGAVAIAVSGGAVAQTSGWYIGGDVGQVDFGDEDDTGFRILGGHQFNRNFAAELGYSQLFDKEGVKVNAWEVVGIGSLPLTNQFSVFGKLGFARLEAKGFGMKETDTELTYGAGVQFNASPRLGIRGQWQRYDTDEEGDFISLGVIYRF
jgi:OmpA-OmpF porin, OOP family